MIPLADAKGDGKRDLVIYNSSNGAAYTGLNNGSGVFAYQYSYWGNGRLLGR